MMTSRSLFGNDRVEPIGIEPWALGLFLTFLVGFIVVFSILRIRFALELYSPCAIRRFPQRVQAARQNVLLKVEDDASSTPRRQAPNQKQKQKEKQKQSLMDTATKMTTTTMAITDYYYEMKWVVPCLWFCPWCCPRDKHESSLKLELLPTTRCPEDDKEYDDDDDDYRNKENKTLGILACGHHHDLWTISGHGTDKHGPFRIVEGSWNPTTHRAFWVTERCPNDNPAACRAPLQVLIEGSFVGTGCISTTTDTATATTNTSSEEDDPSLSSFSFYSSMLGAFEGRGFTNNGLVIEFVDLTPTGSLDP